jgi:hypothetical protein
MVLTGLRHFKHWEGEWCVGNDGFYFYNHSLL